MVNKKDILLYTRPQAFLVSRSYKAIDRRKAILSSRPFGKTSEYTVFIFAYLLYGTFDRNASKPYLAEARFQAPDISDAVFPLLSYMSKSQSTPSTAPEAAIKVFVEANRMKLLIVQLH